MYRRLLSSHPLGRGLDSSSNESVTLLGVREIFTMEDLEFPILLDKSVRGGGIPAEHGSEDGGEHACELSSQLVFMI